MKRFATAVLAAGVLIAVSACAMADFTFIQISDTHSGAKQTAYNGRYREVVRQINAAKPAFVIHTGDAQEIMSPENIEAFKEITKGIAVPVYTVPGNHDIIDLAKAGAEEGSKRVDTWKAAIGCDHTSFEYDGCTFIGLDGNLWNTGYEMEKEQFKWLETELKKAKGKRIFIFQHQPIFLLSPADPNGEYFEVQNPARGKLLDLFKKYRVEAVITGHFHRFNESTYERISYITSPAVSFSCIADQGLTGYTIYHVFTGGLTHHFIDLRTGGAAPEFTTK